MTDFVNAIGTGGSKTREDEAWEGPGVSDDEGEGTERESSDTEGSS